VSALAAMVAGWLSVARPTVNTESNTVVCAPVPLRTEANT
jgi:hypothetical protein